MKSMRKVLAGVTLAGALTMPLAGVAAANGDNGNHSTRGSGGVATGATGSGAKLENKNENKGGAKLDNNGRTGGDPAERPTTVAGVQAACQERITRRLSDLDRLDAKLAARADVLTPAHAAAIAAIVTDARAGLSALATEIGAATTLDALKPLCDRIVTDFRIYALRLPQASLVLAADALIAKQTTFAALRGKLETAIAAGSTPENSAAVAALLADFDGHVAAMLAKAATVSDPVLALTPAAYNADHSVLKPFVTSMKDARSEAKLASKSARQILHLVGGEPQADDDHAPHGADN
jgi:hypothetical protein